MKLPQMKDKIVKSVTRIDALTKQLKKLQDLRDLDLEQIKLQFRKNMKFQTDQMIQLHEEHTVDINKIKDELNQHKLYSMRTIQASRILCWLFKVKRD